MDRKHTIPYKEDDIEKYVRMGWWTDETFGDLMDRAADLHPQKEALVDDKNRLTYGELRDRVDRLAAVLIGLGIKPGDCVLLQLPNWAEWVYSYFALQKIGAIVVLLITGHRQQEIHHLCSMTNAKAWILPGTYRKTDYLPIIRDVIGKNEALEHVILVREDRPHHYHSLEGILEDNEIREEKQAEIARRSPQPTQMAGLIPTGGTTGLPKLSMRTHSDYICGARAKAESLGRREQDIALIFTPVGHNLGLVMVTMTVLTFGKIVLLDSTRPEDICSTIQKEGVTFLNLVPVLLTRLVNFERLKEYDIRSLKKLHVGAQHSPPELKRSAHEILGVPQVISAFGMAEGPALNTRLSDPPEIIYSTVGKPCCPHDAYRVIDGNENPLPPNTEGEFAAKGPSIFSGYFAYDNSRTFTKDGFFKTGDLAVMDDGGYVRITGRIKDVIIRGGVNISAAAVEELIIQHPEVVDAAVIGLPDKEWGEKVCACVQPVPGKDLKLDEIVSFLKEKGVAGMLIPERIEIMERFPLTPAGKSDKKAMRKEVEERINQGK